MRVFDGVPALEAAVGTHLGYSGWHTISQEQIDAFAAVTGDHQWIHVDAPKAAAGPFGTTIAHGFLTLSLVPLLTWQVYSIEGVRMAVNYGADKVRFPSPVPADTKVRAGVELTAVKQTSAGYQVVTRVTVEGENSDKPSCVVDMIALVVP
jgi:acyl dehydratase